MIYISSNIFFLIFFNFYFPLPPLINFDPLLLRPSHHFNPLHPTTLHSTRQHFRSSRLNFTRTHFTNLSYGLIPFKFPTLPLHLISVQFTSLPFTALLDDFLHLPGRRLVLSLWVKAAISKVVVPVCHYGTGQGLDSAQKRNQVNDASNTRCLRSHCVAPHCPLHFRTNLHVRFHTHHVLLHPQVGAEGKRT
jgi:hypothetical protein